MKLIERVHVSNGCPNLLQVFLCTNQSLGLLAAKLGDLSIPEFKHVDCLDDQFVGPLKRLLVIPVLIGSTLEVAERFLKLLNYGWLCNCRPLLVFYSSKCLVDLRQECSLLAENLLPLRCLSFENLACAFSLPSKCKVDVLI